MAVFDYKTDTSFEYLGETPEAFSKQWVPTEKLKNLQMSWSIEHILQISDKLILGDSKGYVKIVNIKNFKLIKDLGMVFANELSKNALIHGSITTLLSYDNKFTNEVQLYAFASLGIAKTISTSMFS